MQSQSSRTERACEECGTHFWVTPWDLANRPARWCSRRCADIGRKAGAQRTCLTCGTTFYVYPSSVRRGRRNDFCSHACKGAGISATTKGRERAPEHSAAISRAKKGKSNGKLLKEPVQVQCEQCGRVWEWAGRETNRAKRTRFCSTGCAYEYFRERPEATGQYIGGRCFTYGPNWKDQARRARERDEHTCQECGKVQMRPRLHVHHVTARRHFNGDWRRANDLHNLVTLCTSCHTTREAALRAAIRALSR
jgi:5-methylcytosine-specific restriction endonuclease McrA